MSREPSDFSGALEKTPLLFVGHGSPMNAIEDSEFDRGWAEVGRALPRPQMTFCVSAHRRAHGTHIIAMTSPHTNHDAIPKHIAGGQ